MNSMQFSLDFRSEVSAAAQIIEQVQQKIADGSLQPGDQLPTVRQLASDLRVNFNTVARAYRMLDEAGLISTQRGRGTYILDAAEPEIGSQLKKSTLDAQIRQFLELLTRQGYSIEEIEKDLAEALQSWAKDTSGIDKDIKQEE